MNDDPLSLPNTPLVLIILSGWGIAPQGAGNILSLAQTVNFNNLVNNYPCLSLLASGTVLGRGLGQSENTFLAHKIIGTGQVFSDNFNVVNSAIKDGSFFSNPVLIKLLTNVRKTKTTLHLLGLLSESSHYSSFEHLRALLQMAKKNKVAKVKLHFILDGIDVPSMAALGYLQKWQDILQKLKIGTVASLIGRNYALKTNFAWDKVALTYKTLFEGKTKYVFDDPVKALHFFYEQKIYDDSLPPVLIGEKSPIASDDSLIYFNFSPQSSCDLISAITNPCFIKFKRPHYLRKLNFVSLAGTIKDLPFEAAFNVVHKQENSLASILSLKNIPQLHVSETLGFPKVTYFFNGEKENSYRHEDWELISSEITDVDSPEMRTNEITENLLRNISKDKYRFLVASFPALDAVAKNKDSNQLIKCAEIIDSALGKLSNTVLAHNGTLLITADHGLAENFIDVNTGQFNILPSVRPVPFIAVSQKYEGQCAQAENLVNTDLSLIAPTGTLEDIAPTVLSLLDISIPEYMKGQNLLESLK